MSTQTTQLLKKAYCAALKGYIWKEGRTISSICDMVKGPYIKFSDRKLDPKAADTLIPKKIHHIWFTNEQSPKEPNIDNIIKTHGVILKYSTEWTHALWTNNKKLIPNTVTILEGMGIKVFEIENLMNPRAYEFIQYNIEKKYWGIASDIARLVILEQHGGIYTDVNYILDHIPVKEMSTYRFFAQSRDGVHIGNYFIASTPYNKVLTTWIGYIEENLSDTPPPYIIEAKKTNDIREVTLATTALPSCLAFFCSESEKAIIFTNSECTESSQECLGLDPTGHGAETWLL